MLINDIMPRFIRSAANVWADQLSRDTDSADWQLNPRVFAYMSRLWDPHSVGNQQQAVAEP